ncbi:Flowering time control protein FPA [Quillaja saponaria]|uniref:Flowering time control protein FPA n=1 Tax=Quillaja saponaria TaxID=32244 RepID=A0AAD7LL90_QUISA|nr:Flowering time control protein FPA [Quillaja saponaria]
MAIVLIGTGGLRTSGINTYEHSRFEQKGSELAVSQDMYQLPGSPTRDRHTRSHDFLQRFPPKGVFSEDPWDLPEDVQYFHEAKKLKIGSLPPEKELPEYPFSGIEKQRHVFPKLLSDFPPREGLDKNFEAGPFSYRQTLDRTPNLPLSHAEGSDSWKQSYDSIQMGSGSLQSKFAGRRFMTEPDKSSLTEWKWEGTIAKGGTPVCRARCFPVGKILDIMLLIISIFYGSIEDPNTWTATARTGLDMLSKHYYQAADTWVIFFVPESDADIGYYNEFMHYLEEKQRAAVAKLDDKTTLFLVPPSDFSQKVLKVPGKLSISGVVLRLESPGSNFGPIHNHTEINNAHLLSFNGDTFYPKPSPAAPNPPSTSLSELGKSEIRNLSFLGNMVTSAPPASFSGSGHAIGSISNSREGTRHEYPFQQRNPTSGPNWSSQNQQNLISGTRSSIPQVSHGAVDNVVPDNQHIMQRTMQDVSSNQYAGGVSGVTSTGTSKLSLHETRPLASLSMPGGALQPDQLAQLASSLLGQPRQSGSTLNISTGEAFRQPAAINVPETPYTPSQKFGLESNQVNSDHSAPQVGQVEQLQKLQQQTSDMLQVPQMAQREQQRGFQGNQQMLNTSTHEEADADPQKRLQATLQLAAVLLQQIQQGKGS